MLADEEPVAQRQQRREHRESDNTRSWRAASFVQGHESDRHLASAGRGEPIRGEHFHRRNPSDCRVVVHTETLAGVVRRTDSNAPTREEDSSSPSSSSNSGNLSSLAGTAVSSLACAKYEVGIREQSPDSRCPLAILPMCTTPRLLVSLIAGRICEHHPPQFEPSFRRTGLERTPRLSMPVQVFKPSNFRFFSLAHTCAAQGVITT